MAMSACTNRTVRMVRTLTLVKMQRHHERGTAPQQNHNNTEELT